MVSHLFKKVLEWVKVVQTNNVASKTYQDVEIVNYDRALEFLRNTYHSYIDSVLACLYMIASKLVLVQGVICLHICFENFSNS